MVKLSGLAAFEQNLLALADLDSRTGSLITAGFCADVLASDTLKIGDIPALATLANVPVELLQFPSHGTEEVLPKLVGKPSPVTLLQAFGNAVEKVTRSVINPYLTGFQKTSIGPTGRIRRSSLIPRGRPDNW